MLSSRICAVFSSLLLLGVAWTGGDTTGVEPDGVIPQQQSRKTKMSGWRPKCECVQTAKWVKPVRRITKIAVHEPSWYCSRTEIILTVEGNREVCLDPDSEQGQKLQHCWKSHDMNVAKTKTCLRRKKTVH
ncbi:C-X-C motif chemokine 9-like isoform X1 [Conger conger]|uniref:C-X-C motif chemokine 9-like isoform X1 n=1 Tax=Conger conger TaxID=82655 RepID=UPI002A59EDE0|nr:C-X-C motif chemokine 9-like isoform X1 [Conger conger]